MFSAVLIDIILKAEKKYGKFGLPLVCSGFLLMALTYLALIFALSYFTPNIDRRTQAEDSGMNSLHIIGPKGIRVFP